jgi:hypothetical protein
MIQYVLVAFPRLRDVFINGRLADTTGTVFRVRQGASTFDLGTPADYTPSRQTVNVSGTTQDAPRIVRFRPK